VGEPSFAAGLVGIVLDGRYRLDALLGEGGMGAVFRAHHLAMDRKVAVKLLKPHLSTDEIALQRFLREARATIKVDSPHAVKVLDYGVTPFANPNRDYYIVLEYLDGRSVQRELEIDGPFAPSRVVHIARQALHGLAAAHRMGLVHRDIKPDNILVMRVGDDPDYAKVLDFGVAKLMAGSALSSHSQLALTQAGMVFGTPEFMSPEQACGQELDGRSDLYSLAATMFAMLTGCGLYVAKSPIEWLTNHARTPPPHLRDGLPDLARFVELDKLLQRCLAKHKTERPATAEEMSRLLGELEPTLTRRSGEQVGRATIVGRGFKTAPSSYFLPVPADTVGDVGYQDTLPPPITAPALSASASQPSTGMTGEVERERRSRGLGLVIGAVVVVGVIVAAVVIAATKRGGGGSDVGRGSASTSSGVGKTVEVAPQDAGVGSATPAGSGSGTGSGTRTQAGSGTGDPHPLAGPGSASGSGKLRPVNIEVARHVMAAEQARREHKTLRQFSEADAALRLDPHSARARFLRGDALVVSGDLDQGCKDLHALGKSQGAVERATSAGCPTD
jgi:serine/threonine protein kinase